jgi:hypothetical protein
MAADIQKLTSIVQRFETDLEFQQQMGARLLPYYSRLAENNQRVNRLLQFFDEDLKEREGGEDILLAAVVLIHASLEDFLRTLASELLPAGDESSLKDIPLATSESFGRNEKFVLGQLAQHRGKTVDELLRQSVSDHLSRSNYNNTKEIALLLTKIGFNPEEHNAEFAAIDQMIQRRHQIVHCRPGQRAVHTSSPAHRTLPSRQLADGDIQFHCAPDRSSDAATTGSPKKTTRHLTVNNEAHPATAASQLLAAKPMEFGGQSVLWASRNVRMEERGLSSRGERKWCARTFTSLLRSPIRLPPHIRDESAGWSLCQSKLGINSLALARRLKRNQQRKLAGRNERSFEFR